MKKCCNVPSSSLFDDPCLRPFLGDIRRRAERALEIESRITGDKMSLLDFASAHEYFGLHMTKKGWVFREWAPNAESIFIVGPFSDWKPLAGFEMKRINEAGVWEIGLPENALKHADPYRLSMRWPGGAGERVPAYARRVVQDANTKIFNAQAWFPKTPYMWKHANPRGPCSFPLIYEAHPGMAQEEPDIGAWIEFADLVLPRIVDAGYNTIQLMAVMEHPYYASFGYHVSGFFSASSRFGTPDDLKAVVDRAHGAGLRVIIDLVHSHAVKNEVEGISRFDGTLYQYFHEGPRGFHEAWDSRCFDYGKPEVLHFLLSNCRFWIDEYHVDGFRFDGVTSMLYRDHGLGQPFTSYDRYFDDSVDEDAYVYLNLANKLIHVINPDALTIAEDVSGMPGLAAPIKDGGCGFDYRLAMGIPDCWFKLVKDVRDETWNMGYLWHELTNRRSDEKTISYAESHDQALVGGKTLMFEMGGAAMYDSMRADDDNVLIERAVSLHKMIRLATLGSAGHGYLNFMGNEFGHPEWIDFPREGNDWSFHYARRQWSLRDDPDLKYHFLADFDAVMMDMVRGEGFFETCQPHLLLLHEDDKILAFARGDLLFVFNFHSSRSVVGYRVAALPGEYVLFVNTDELRFGGMNRLVDGQHYFSHSMVQGKEQLHFVRVYIPCRTALVLRRSRQGYAER